MGCCNPTCACAAIDGISTVQTGAGTALSPLAWNLVLSGDPGNIATFGGDGDLFVPTSAVCLSPDPCNDITFDAGCLFLERGGAVADEQVTAVPDILVAPGPANTYIPILGSTAFAQITNPSCDLSMVLFLYQGFNAFVQTASNMLMEIRSSISVNAGPVVFGGDSFRAPTAGYSYGLQQEISSALGGFLLPPAASLSLQVDLEVRYDGPWAGADAFTLFSNRVSLWGFTAI